MAKGQGNKPKITLVPEKIKFENGRPTLAEESVNAHIDAFTRTQKNMGKDTKKAADILAWQLDEIHKSLNPKNIGKIRVMLVENPDFDKTKEISDENPFLVEEYEHMFNPSKFKENSITTTAQLFLKNNEQRIRELQEQEKEIKKMQKEANAALEELAEADKNSSSNKQPLFTFEYEGDDNTPSVN